MSFFFLKNKYACHRLLNEARSFQTLVRTGRGEAQIWEWIEALVQHHSVDMDRPLLQKLLKASLDHDLAPALMLASAGNPSPMIVKVPKPWRSFLRTKGVHVHPLSGHFWRISVLQKFREGLGVYKRLCHHSLSSPSGPYAVLCGIHDNTYTSIFDHSGAQDFLQWFRKRFPYSQYWVIPVSSSKNKSADNCLLTSLPFPGLARKEKKAFQTAARKIIVSAFLDLLAGKWKSAYILSSLLEECYVRQIPIDHLAKFYAFTNALYIERPLWTYEAEKRGAKIAMFFYGTNNFNYFLTGGGSYGVAPGYSLMTWPIIFTQHENHKQALQAIVSADTIINVPGLIPYEDNGASIDLSGKIKIVYLDVQPFRTAFMASIGRPCHIYTEDISSETFQDIVALAAEFNASLFIKPKRNVGKRLSPPYRKMLQNAEALQHVTITDPYFSPQRLCENADIVICQPFTTAALFAKSLGKPVVYYDAQGLFLKDQLACQGIPLLSGRVELKNWLAEVIHVSETAA